jgi:hypothetical protein
MINDGKMFPSIYSYTCVLSVEQNIYSMVSLIFMESSISYFIVLIFANNVYKAIHDFCGAMKFMLWLVHISNLINNKCLFKLWIFFYIQMYYDYFKIKTTLFLFLLSLMRVIIILKQILQLFMISSCSKNKVFYLYLVQKKMYNYIEIWKFCFFFTYM